MNQEQLEKFIKLWQHCTVAEVVKQINKQLGAGEQLSTRDASAIATILRAQGVELRDQRRKTEVDYEALNKVAREAGQ